MDDDDTGRAHGSLLPCVVVRDVVKCPACVIRCHALGRRYEVANRFSRVVGRMSWQCAQQSTKGSRLPGARNTKGLNMRNLVVGSKATIARSAFVSGALLISYRE